MPADRVEGVPLYEAAVWYDDGTEFVAAGESAYFRDHAEAREWLLEEVAKAEDEEPATGDGYWYGHIDKGSFVRDGTTGFDEIDLTWESDPAWAGEIVRKDV